MGSGGTSVTVYLTPSGQGLFAVRQEGFSLWLGDIDVLGVGGIIFVFFQRNLRLWVGRHDGAMLSFFLVWRDGSGPSVSLWETQFFCLQKE